MLPKLPHGGVRGFYMFSKSIGVEQGAFKQIVLEGLLHPMAERYVGRKPYGQCFVCIETVSHKTRKTHGIEQTSGYPSRKCLALARQHRESCP